MSGSASVPATNSRPVEWGVVLAIAVAALGYCGLHRVAFLAMLGTPETFDRELDYLEG